MAEQSPLSVIVNRNGGAASRSGDKLPARLRDAFRSAGTSIALQLVDGGDVAAAVQRAVRDTVAVGGGDGTISAAAGVLAGTGKRLAVLPLGTLNHFAQAIGLDGSLK